MFLMFVLLRNFIFFIVMIQDFADWLVYGIFGLSADTQLGSAVNFFLFMIL